LVIPDASLDDRFNGEFHTNGPRVRFYAGVAVCDWNGHAVGTLSVMDERPNTLTAVQEETLQALSRQASAQVELCQGLELLAQRIDELKMAQAHMLASERLTLLGRLSACIAHEVNNPLSCVISNLAYVSQELSQGDTVRSADVQQALTEASEGADRIRKTVQALRRLERGGSIPVDLALQPE
jgi:C4-dicarboxylate-specific signal transduction histidine kinase